MSWHPKTIADEVRRELSRFGAAAAMPDVVAAWPEAVGPAIAANAWPARLGRDGTLHVSASSSSWAFELTQLEATIRERLRERLTTRAPTRLRFAVGRLPEPERPGVEPLSRTVRKVGARVRAAGEEIAASIENEDLRRLVAQAASASLARGAGEADDRGLWYTKKRPDCAK